MPVYKTLILNKEIIVKYEENQKDQLIESIKEINNKLTSYDNLNGKISDRKLLTLLAIKLQAELLDLNKNQEKKINETETANINLNDKIYKLNIENKLLKKENELINLELIKVQNQIDIIINLIKETYEE